MRKAWNYSLLLKDRQKHLKTFNEYSLKTVLIFLCLYAMGIGVYFSSRENRRPGEEHGSAKLGRKHLCTFATLKYQQEDGMQTVLPYVTLNIKATEM